MPDWRWAYRLRLRFRTLFRRARVERELEEEFSYHLEQRTEQEIARGHTPRHGRIGAEAGGMPGRARHASAGRPYARPRLRGPRFGRNRAFAAVSVLTLALGIGASIAILTVVNALILRHCRFRILAGWWCCLPLRLPEIAIPRRSRISRIGRIRATPSTASPRTAPTRSMSQAVARRNR